MTEEQEFEIKKSMCFFCKPRCIQTVYVKDDHLVKVDPSPIRGCPRWRVTGEWFYHPDRLKFPRKRVGEKGQDKWEQISWDQALDEIAAKLQETKEKYGAEAVAVTAGTSRTYEELNSRFLNLEGIDPWVVHAQHGWWYPEMPGEEPWLHGVWISNVNVLTDDDLDHCDEALGSWPLKTMQCKVYKVKRYGTGAPLPL